MIGIIMIALLFVGLFALIWRIDSLKCALFTYSITIAIITYVMIAAYFLASYLKG